MKKFEFYAPTKILFGPNSEKQVGDIIRKLEKKSILILYGGGSVIKNGLLANVEESLTSAGISYIIKGGVKPNPRLDFALEAIELAKAEQIDFVLAVGGGSVIDTAKAVALGAANPEDYVWDYYLGKKIPNKTFGVGVVLTLPATGSETSISTVLTKKDESLKTSFNDDINRPVFAILNPEVTFSLPRYQVSCGIVDIMMHTLDRYFTAIEGNETTDQIAEAILRVTIDSGSKAMRNQQDYNSMSELMWCGSLSHNGITGLGSVPDFAPHKLSHPLSAIYDVAHGASLSAIWGSWARYVYLSNPERFARYGKNVWDIEEQNLVKAAELAIRKTELFFESIEMPVSIPELKIGTLTNYDLQVLADVCSQKNSLTIGQFRGLNSADMFNIYQMANNTNGREFE